MASWWQRFKRSRRSPRRLLSHILESRYGTAETVLSAVAVVLVVWLLWPEERTPQFERRAQQATGVEQVERQGAEASGERAEKRVTEPQRAQEPAPSTVTLRPVEPERRRLIRPSELADRLDENGQRPGRLSSARAFLPTQRPSEAVEPVIDIEPLLQAKAAPVLGEDRPEPLSAPEPAADTVQAALADVINTLQARSSTTATGLDDTDGQSQVTLDLASPPAELLDTDPLEFEPFPDVDLSDLNTLIPVDESPADAGDELVEAEQAVAALTPMQDAAVAPFVAEDDPAQTPAGVSQRPRADKPTWLANAVSAAIDDDRPIIAVVVDDLGLNRPATASLNELPSPLTLAFLPYAGRIEAQTEAAHAAGHELMLHLPMEPNGSDWPGPDALTTRIDRDEFTARLVKNLSRFEGFVGVNNHMGSRLTADRTRMEVVMRELRQRDVLFLDSKTSARSVAGDVAGINGVPNTTRDVFLDHVIDPGTIRRQLARVERIARQTGSAVAIGHPHDATIKALREWLPSLGDRGFALAPISAVVARRACNSGVLIAADTCGRYLQARSPNGADLAAKDG